MAIPVEMPKMSDTMEEGVLAAWLVEEGEKISAGDVVAQVETDKATMDLEVYDDGVLLKRVIAEGDAVPIGGLIAVLGTEGEDISALLASYGSSAGSSAADATDAAGAAEAVAAAPTPAPAPETVTSTGGVPSVSEVAQSAPLVGQVSESGSSPRVKASPLAKKLADEHGLDLSSMKGSGPEGRIVKRDIEAALSGSVVSSDVAAPVAAAAGAAPPATSAQPVMVAPAGAPETVPVVQPARAPVPAAAPVVRVSDGAYDVVRISQMRKTIARRLAESKFTNPHFYLTADLDMSIAMTFRSQLNEKAAERDLGKVSVNDLVTKACALALRKHSWVNASWMEAQGEIHLHHDVNVAIAVAVDEGLITPVIRHADRKGLAEIGAETKSLALRARNRELQPEDWSGSTFSTSNLGMFGIDEFTAIINPPNACILAIGAIRDTPVVRGGAVVPGKQMKVTLSCDHRVVDGVAGSEFLATVRGFLEDPLTMLL